MFGLGIGELLIIGAIAVLLFGKRLPEVARSMGKGVVAFKKGIRGIEDDVDRTEYATSTTKHYDETDHHEEAAAPKFEPPASEPKEEVKEA